jgi:hypothetical protein
VPIWNLYAGWIGILLGFLTGSLYGLFFHEERWLGGYGSWPRRISRLGHVSLLGLAFINMAFVFSADYLGLRERLAWPSWLLIIGTITMPLTCYLSAWKPGLRRLFVVPSLSLVAAVVTFLIRLVR